MPRDGFDTPSNRTLAARAGTRCSRPDCRKHTSGPQEDPAKAVNICVATHPPPTRSGQSYGD